ncbi:MAG: hypothetical protein AAGC55_18845, partial [Myxococcota bacterium]
LRSVVAAFALIREVYGTRPGDQGHKQLKHLADTAREQLNRNNKQEDEQLFVALQAGLVVWRELNDIERAQQYFDRARQIDPDAPDLRDFDAHSGNGSAGHGAEEGTLEHSDASSIPDSDESSTATGEAEPHGGDGAGAEALADGAPGPGGDGDDGDAAMGGAEPDGRPAVEDEEDEPPEEISAELQAAMDGASSVDDWTKVINDFPDAIAPRRGLAGVHREAQKWKPLIDTLKAAVDKATRRSDKVEFLREIAEVYRGHMRNEQQAITALNQILDVDPRNMAIYDELVAHYESKKRWPDLVATLNKKADALPGRDDKVEVYLSIATLYIERFSNQAEAIKAFERVLEFDPNNEKAVAHLLDVYQKRRDWEKLIRLHETQIDRTEDPVERAEKTYEIAKLAATRVKKPDVCIVWWEKVLADDPAHEEAIAELYKLYERSKSWDKLAEICAKQANIAPDEKTQVDALQKLGILYTDKLDRPDKAIDAWRQLLYIDENHRRAQDAIKKLYIAQKNWNDLEEFYRDRGKLDEFVRLMERQIDTGDKEDQLDLALKVAVLYRDELEKPDRAMRAFEKVLTIDDNNLAAAEALIPLYEKGRDPRKLVRALEIQLSQTEEMELRQERIRRLAEYSEDKLRDKGAAFGWWLKAHEEDHAAEWIREQLERLAGETEAWVEL